MKQKLIGGSGFMLLEYCHLFHTLVRWTYTIYFCWTLRPSWGAFKHVKTLLRIFFWLNTVVTALDNDDLEIPMNKFEIVNLPDLHHHASPLGPNPQHQYSTGK
ncbi:hypothetical protein DCAR_0831002 [Daucus carota subsp. sativus]|uniref:Uncharacterized protein n=1 Tax=Daucus carota subsp. sativus TaxID=79200 RepID=A0A175YBK0_DAUCS|nr:hypothetical protein DCAR_0831002 [Daucus carota subsp. sativus]